MINDPDRRWRSNDPITRNLVAQFVEESGADSIIVLWTVGTRDSTAVRMASWGNQIACRAMLDYATEAYDSQDDNK